MCIEPSLAISVIGINASSLKMPSRMLKSSKLSSPNQALTERMMFQECCCWVPDGSHGVCQSPLFFNTIGMQSVFGHDHHCLFVCNVQQNGHFSGRIFTYKCHRICWLQRRSASNKAKDRINASVHPLMMKYPSAKQARCKAKLKRK